MAGYAICTSDTRRGFNPLIPSLMTRPPLHISSWGGVRASATYPSLVLRAIQDKLDSGVDDKILPETQQPPTQSNLRGEAHHFAAKDPLNPISIGSLSPFREQYWNKIQALKVQRNLQIIHEAHQHLKKMLLGGGRCQIHCIRDTDQSELYTDGSAFLCHRSGSSRFLCSGPLPEIKGLKKRGKNLFLSQVHQLHTRKMVHERYPEWMKRAFQ